MVSFCTVIGQATISVGGLMMFISMLNILAFVGAGMYDFARPFLIELFVGSGMGIVGLVCSVIGVCVEDRDRMSVETVPLMEVVTH